MLDVTKNAVQMAIISLGQAFKDYFAGTAEYPTVKKKDRHDSFALTNDPFTVKGRPVHIPILGWVRMHEPLRFIGKVLALATLSTGAKIAGPKAYAATWKKLRRVSKQWSRQMEAAKVRAGLQPSQPLPTGMPIPLSQNMRKTPRRMARLHAQIRNIRADAWPHLTTDLVDRCDVIAIEDLNGAGMLKNHKLAQAIADMGLGEFRRQLEYKAAPRSKTVIVVIRWYPRSKTCSICADTMPKMPLSVREWTRPQCGDQFMESGREIDGWRSVCACLTADLLGGSLRSALPWTTGQWPYDRVAC